MITLKNKLDVFESVARAIRKEYDLGALIKWPNDILLGDRKVGGLLLEVSSTGSRINACFLGIGIDANVPLSSLSPELRRSVTSLCAELGRDVPREPFLAGVLWELAKHLFGWYVLHIATYSIFYGSLSTLVIFVLWVYYSSTILVVGGEFAYFLEEDRQRSTA